MAVAQTRLARSVARRAAVLVTCGLPLVASACSDEGEIGAGTPTGGGTAAPGNVLDGLSVVTIHEPTVGRSATDLDFNPVREGELWVTVREYYDDTLSCDDDSPAGDPACAQLEGKILFFEDATVDDPNGRLRVDPNGWHFLRRPPAIAFGPNDTFATCGEARTGNFENNPPDYIGPTMWSSDPNIFGNLIGEDANGSHLDMLHSSPFCVGIAHDADNAYFVFNGQLGSVDRYDFNAPHPPGADDHSDGELTRYVEGRLTRLPNVPGHMVVDDESNLMFIADTGGARIVAFDVTSGEPGHDIPSNDPLQIHHAMVGVELMEVVAPGTLERPAGVALHPEGILVTDNATSAVHVFSTSGQERGRLDTDLPEGTLGGVVMGPDGRIYLADLLGGRVFRLEE